MTLTDSLLTMLRTAMPDHVIYDGDVPKTPEKQYVVLYSDMGTWTNSAIAGSSHEGAFSFQVTSVSGTSSTFLRREVEHLAAKVREALIDQVPVVPGFLSSRIVHTLSTIPEVDEAIQDRRTMFAVDQYAVTLSKI